MFTGLIEDVGTVTALRRTDQGARISIESRLARELGRGDSIAVDGACLTAVELGATAFAAEISNESLARTTLGELAVRSRVNLERALAVGARVGGHYVLGHVDGCGRVVSVTALGNASRVDIEFPAALAPLLVEKGSVTVDGVSLTVNEVSARSFWVALIPETQLRTVLSGKSPGARVNLEGDILGKYVRALETSGRVPAIDEAFLAKNGYT